MVSLEHKENSNRVRAISASVIGNALEWYDFTVYAFLAPIIGSHFFPTSDKSAALLSSFAVFGVGFLARPLGGILIGMFGDRFGRKPALLFTIVAMAMGTGVIGILPGYDAIGIAAPILLVFARVLQGFSAGGEWGGSASFLVEWAPPNRRGLYGSLHPASIFFGQLVGLGTTAILASALGQETLEAWAWRIPFILGALVGPFGLLVRRMVGETPAFEHASKSNAIDEPKILRTLAHAFCLVAVQSVVVYTFFSYFPTFMQTHLGLDASQALWSTTVANLVVMVTTILAGALSDFIGSRGLMLLHSVFFLLMTYPILSFLTAGQPPYSTIVLIHIGLAIFTGLFLGSFPTALVDCFPTKKRLTGLGIAYNISSMTFGGFAPFVATYLIKLTGSPSSVSFYVIFGALLSTLAISRMPASRRENLKVQF
ncbi:MFS transporter [Caballeronia insecticola]|uniref:General substrate transporter n=1 Tax=Caballeronia insecticola TaxID=758793 RepID=R4X2R2_9BURK|nr:MFS transporter [Caballeronia insecticola]BAN26881.1 general substrate transporter [Caballeronia insecticola]